MRRIALICEAGMLHHFISVFILFVLIWGLSGAIQEESASGQFICSLALALAIYVLTLKLF